MANTVELAIDAALGQRIRAVAEVLLPPDIAAPLASSSWDDIGELLYLVVDDVHRELTPPRMWLLWTALSTVMPDADDVREAMRMFELLPADDAMHWLMEICLGAALDFGNPSLELQIATNSVLVEVDFSARFNLHTGIQRVVRALLPLWDREHAITPIAWAPGYGLTRTLTIDEADRVLRWHGGSASEIDASTTALDPHAWSLLLPWNSVVVLAEVPARDVCERLAALAEHSGNRVVGIAYDCIPVVSADLVPPAEPNRFVRYLSIVKHMRQLAGISVSATAEFQGFADALTTQGISGPHVFECRLPTEAIGSDRPDASRDRRPSVSDGLATVLCVGSFEPRKNQIAVLYAAETLWREGLQFKVQFIGGGGWGTEMDRLVKRLRRLGRSVSVARAISDADLAQAFQDARFSVFASIHEGYGLPVAESLAFRLPVITTSYGSTAEIGAGHGALLVDPRSDDELTDAMRLLLTDDERLDDLRRSSDDIELRTWQTYSDDLWAGLVEPERSCDRSVSSP